MLPTAVLWWVRVCFHLSFTLLLSLLFRRPLERLLYTQTRCIQVCAWGTDDHDE